MVRVAQLAAVVFWVLLAGPVEVLGQSLPTGGPMLPIPSPAPAARGRAATARLSACPAEEVDQQIETGLRRIVEDLRVDLAGVWALPDGSDEVRLTHSWTRDGVPPLPTVIRESEAPGIFSRLRQGHVVRLPPSGDPPDELLIARQSLAQFGARSTAVVPLMTGSAVMGGLSVGTVREPRRWPDELIARLRLLADVVAHALARQGGERAAHESAEHIRNLAGRLMTAQEEERRRLARELHDDVNQQVAALSIALSVLGKRLPTDPVAALRDDVAGLQARTAELAEAVHAGARHVGVTVARDGADLALTVSDDGRRFDLQAARGQDGLGLISLDERVRLARGRLTIDTQPQRGTTLRIVVPLAEAQDSTSSPRSVTGGYSTRRRTRSAPMWSSPTS